MPSPRPIANPVNPPPYPVSDPANNDIRPVPSLAQWELQQMSEAAYYMNRQQLAVERCPNCTVRFHRSLRHAVFTAAPEGRQIWYCSIACAEAMPFLTAAQQQRMANDLQAQVYQQHMQQAQYVEQMQQSQLVQQINDAQALITGTTSREWSNWGTLDQVRRGASMIRRSRQTQPYDFTGPEPEDL